MALIKCLDCEKEHSDLAPACPNCGRPTAAKKPVVIEQTAKKWKDQQTIALFIIVFSLTLLFTPLYAWGALFSAGGLIMYLRARYGAWYHHG